MTATEFEQFWAASYGPTPPISFLFKWDFPERWFRIHSLPEAQRYAASEADWQELLHRQNTLLTDLMGADAPILLVTGEFTDTAAPVPTELSPFLSDISFTTATPILLETNHFPEDTQYYPMFNESTWQSGKYDVLLRAIADDNLRAFFISREYPCIVAPYDGGVDIILKDSATRDVVREKYTAWLSERADGL
ncbi:hypothetical protein CLV59_105155 [Chitinophaga dinghuensis]|uniref:DUF3885 domain-containing protein n=1 Tax=Chitinophaga dinghuensis TaxID=1539050 RepID=A0A327W4Z9_9BACT|nr:hypothetical protein [Chitinophaga dinghuensis]RAJ80048.1 hypothetical protein CLV59_105155 [Chitinophaga dinghuensis]